MSPWGKIERVPTPWKVEYVVRDESGDYVDDFPDHSSAVARAIAERAKDGRTYTVDRVTHYLDDVEPVFSTDGEEDDEEDEEDDEA